MSKDRYSLHLIQMVLVLSGFLCLSSADGEYFCFKNIMCDVFLISSTHTIRCLVYIGLSKY